MWLSTGDIMGPTLAGLENLLQVSYGCGEQNMIGFVPNVYVSAYLKATNRLTSTLTNKIQTLLEGGKSLYHYYCFQILCV